MVPAGPLASRAAVPLSSVEGARLHRGNTRVTRASLPAPTIADHAHTVQVPRSDQTTTACGGAALGGRDCSHSSGARDRESKGTSEVFTVDFTRSTKRPLDPSIRVFGPGATVAQDFEPEYIAVDHDSKTAWVTLQENNAIGELDIRHRRVHAAWSASGFKDHRCRATASTRATATAGDAAAITSRTGRSAACTCRTRSRSLPGRRTGPTW